MHIKMSNFETTNLHCFVAPDSKQTALGVYYDMFESRSGVKT